MEVTKHNNIHVKIHCTHVRSQTFSLGVCQCNDDFGGGDCSVDTNEPPPVYAVNYETGGLCDKLFCKEAIVDGDLFLDRSGLTCKMQRFEVSLLYSFNYMAFFLNTCSIISL